MGAAPGAGEGRVVAGVVGKGLGLRGEVYVHPDPDVGDVFDVGATYTAVLRDGATRPVTVVASRLHSGRRVVRFDAVEDRETAEGLRGALLTVARDDVVLDEDAYWADDVVGAEVVDDDGGVVGVVESTLDGTAHDYLVVARPDGGEVLIPAVAQLVTIHDGRVVVHAIPGLLDTSDDPSGDEGA